MREVFAAAAFVIAPTLAGCATVQAPPAAPTAGAIERPTAPVVATAPAPVVTSRIAPPTGGCLALARPHLDRGARLLRAPLPEALATRLDAVVDGLHPAAKRVLDRTRGVWLAEGLPRAAAVFLPCEVDLAHGRGGFILVDADQFPLDHPLADVDVPVQYWRSLGGELARATRSGPGTQDEHDELTEHAVRYLLLHELGHAHSMLTGEFAVDAGGRLRVTDTARFVGLSWRMMTTDRRFLPLPGTSPTVRTVVPLHALDTYEWGSVLAALDADADLFAPGWALTKPRSSATKHRDVCNVAEKLPQAGFVTPTAARYPTEDYAESFAHAILAHEGKLQPTDRLRVVLPGCTVTLTSPWHVSWMSAKRRYMRAALGLDPAQEARGAAAVATAP